MGLVGRTLTTGGLVLNHAVAPVGSRRFQVAMRGTGRPIRLNIGCGPAPLPGWVNCDTHWRTGVYLDITRPWPVAAGSVDVIYADNVIEHVTLNGGGVVFREAHRALKNGGVFRLATPDVERVAHAYLENGDLAPAS